MECPSVLTTMRTADEVTAGMSSHAAAADGSITTTVGLMTSNSPSISGAGLVGIQWRDDCADADSRKVRNNEITTIAT